VGPSEAHLFQVDEAAAMAQDVAQGAVDAIHLRALVRPEAAVDDAFGKLVKRVPWRSDNIMQ
jgi:hypothetical protein